MIPERKIKVTLSKVYEYDVSELYNILIRGFKITEIDESLLLRTSEYITVRNFMEELENSKIGVDIDEDNFLLGIKSEIIDSEEDNVVFDGEDSYLLVRWPDSQDYMDKDWFKDEAVLASGYQNATGSEYFIPIRRIRKSKL